VPSWLTLRKQAVGGGARRQAELRAEVALGQPRRWRSRTPRQPRPWSPSSPFSDLVCAAQLARREPAGAGFRCGQPFESTITRPWHFTSCAGISAGRCIACQGQLLLGHLDERLRIARHRTCRGCERQYNRDHVCDTACHGWGSLHGAHNERTRCKAEITFSNNQGVAIGCSLPCRLQRDEAVAAGTIVDDQLLAPGFREPLADDAQRDVGTAAGRKRRDDFTGRSGKVWAMAETRRQRSPQPAPQRMLFCIS